MAAPATSRAWVYEDATLLPTSLRLINLPTPSQTPDSHVLISVLNVSLNPGDLKFPLLPVLKYFIHKPASICFDFCGRVLALPSDYQVGTDPFKRNLHVGQVVFGVSRDMKNLGTLKEFLYVNVKNVHPVPFNSSLLVEHASGLGVSALTAYQVLAPYNASGGTVLINGATGGVGTFAIQIAKIFGMRVHVTCSKRGADLCRGLGADEVLDYRAEDYDTKLNELDVDLVIDCAGADPDFHRKSERFLRRDGVFILVGIMDDNWSGIRSMLESWARPVWLGGINRKWKVISIQNRTKDLSDVAQLVSSKGIKVVVDSVWSFVDAKQAFERLQGRGRTGKIIVSVADHEL